MSELPQSAERLLTVAPEEFVAERKRLARELRDAGNSAEAASVERMRKPTPVVLAVNRAARGRPKVARAAADAALRVKKTQVSGEPEAYREALKELDESLDMLAQVAVAHLAPGGKAPSEAMRRRIRDLLRSAVADDDTRDALARGVLTEEKEAAGFSPFAGMSPKPARRKGRPATPTAAKEREAKQRTRAKALRDELAQAEKELREAEQSVRDAERRWKKAEKAVASLREKHDQIE